MRVHRIVAPRSARYVTLGRPAAEASEVWFALHGYGQLARRFARWLTPLADAGHAVVVPEGLSRFYTDHGRGIVGASWMTREDRDDEIADYVRYLDAVAEAVRSPDRVDRPVHLLGFSQGSATACRWVERGAIRPARLVLWGGEVPPDLDWALAGPRFRDLEVTLVAGDGDEYFSAKVLERHAETLRANGVRYRVARYPGDHSIDPAALSDLLADRL